MWVCRIEGMDTDERYAVLMSSNDAAGAATASCTLPRTAHQCPASGTRMSTVALIMVTLATTLRFMAFVEGLLDAASDVDDGSGGDSNRREWRGVVKTAPKIELYGRRRGSPRHP